MLSKKQGFRLNFSRFYSRNPEKLWVHYLFAVVIVGGLAILNTILERDADERVLSATQAIQASESTIAQMRETLNLVIAWDRQSDPDAMSLLAAAGNLERLSEGMELRHSTLGGDGIATIPERPIDDRTGLFVSLVRSITTADHALAGKARLRLLTLYEQGFFHDPIIQEIDETARWIEATSIQQSERRSRLLMASFLVVLAEAVLIFWPAHKSVVGSLRKLQQQQAVLQESRQRLGQLNGKLRHMVHHDQLTGLPNRNSLVTYLERIIQRGMAEDKRLYLYGVDGFKIVNETIGHDHGDELLAKVGAAMQDCIDTEDFIARMDGDEFAIVSTENADALITRIAAATSQPFTIKGRRIPCKMSVGHILIGAEKRKPSEILADARIALQSAKIRGRGQACAFDLSLRDERDEKKLLQVELQEAIQNGEIEPWFQPQINLSDGRLRGIEVLARWRHPEHGILTPFAFLDAAESAGLICDLDHAIWKSAFSHARRWKKDGIWDPMLSLNASPDTLADPKLIERFLLILHRSGLRPDQVVVEVLESTLIASNDDMAAINIDQLAECGIGLELDDFGTGYGSLSKLVRLPLTGIKLDRSLVTPLPEPAASSVVRAILALAHELGMTVVAEGIEQKEQAEHLYLSGCQTGQGFGYAKPMPADVFQSWLKIHASLPIPLSEPKAAVARRA